MTGAEGPRLAVVGAGIAGCATADLARRRFGDASIDVFERRSRVGGRVHATTFDSYTLEAGAVGFWGSQRYLMEYAERFDLELIDPLESDADPGPPYAVWDGRSLTSTAPTSPGDVLSLLSNHRLSLPRLWWLSRRVSRKFDSLYDLVESGRPHRTPTEMLEEIGATELCRRSAAEYLRERKVSAACIDEILAPVVRAAYNQNASANAFVALMSFRAMTTLEDYYAVRGGNVRMLERLLEAAGATVHTDAGIAAIAREDGTYALSTGDGAEHGPYDAVVVAAPLGRSDVAFDGVDLPDSFPRNPEYRSMNVAFVKGRLDPAYFGVDARDELPTVISTTDDAGAFDSLGRFRRGSANVYRVNATGELDDDLLGELFSSVEAVQRHSWEAFPVYEPPVSRPPFRLHDGLYYASAMESIISTMETGIVGARNVVNCLESDLGGSAPAARVRGEPAVEG